MASFRYLVDDVEKALPFYQALGFTVKERWGPAFAIVTRADASLWLSGPGTSARKALDDGTVPVPGGWNRFALEVDDLDETIAALAAAGIEVRNAPVGGPGGRQALVIDPSGNPVELFEARNA